MYKVQVSNLPRWISEIHLRHFFASCGDIIQASIALDDNSMRPLGHGYITFHEQNHAKAAIAKSGERLDGAIIHVQAVNLDATEEVIPA